MAGPRSIPYVSDNIESAFNRMNIGYQLDIGKTVVKWGGVQDGVALEIQNVELLCEDNNRTTHLPAIGIDLDFGSLLYGQLHFEEISVLRPEVNMVLFAPTNNDGEADFSGLYTQFIEVLKRISEANNSEFPIKKISLSDVRFVGAEHNYWSVPAVELIVTKVGETYKIVSNVQGVFNRDPFSLQVSAILEGNGAMETRIRVLDITTSTIVEFIPDLHFYKKLPHAIKGDVAFDVSAAGEAVRFDFTAHAQGSETMPGKLDLVGSVDLELSAKGNLLPKIDVEVVAYGVPINQLEKYWPAVYFPLPQEWVTTRIRDGTYTRSHAKISITPDELDAGTLRDDSVVAEVEFDNAVINYYDALPNLHDAQGLVKFENGNIDIVFKKGTIGTSKISESEVHVTKVGENDFTVKLASKFAGDAADLMKFYVLKGEVTGNDWTQLLTGQAESDVKLKFPLAEPEVMEKNFDVTLISSLKNVAIDDMEGYKISEGVFDVKLYSDVMNVSGDLRLNGVQSKLNYDQWFMPNAKMKYKRSLKMIASPLELQSFDIPAYKHASGFAVIDFVEINHGQHVTAKLNVKADELNLKIPEIDYTKPAGMPMSVTAEFANVQDKSLLTIDKFAIDAKNLQARGNAIFSAKQAGYNEVHFDVLKFGKNNTGLKLATDQGNEYRMDITGESVDLSPFFAYKKSHKNQDYDSLESLDIKINVEKAIFAYDILGSKLRADIECKKSVCNKVNAAVKFEEGTQAKLTFDMANLNADGEASFLLKTDAAGKMLRALDMSEHVFGGDLELSAHYKKDVDGLHDGMLIMREFSILKAPVMSKLLTLASFGGIVDVLNGKGIRFDKMSGGFTFAGDNIHLSRFKMTGPSLGITATGNISTLADGDIALEGAAAPASLINTMLGKIPLLGEVFKGKDGDGLIATRYSVTGKADNPDVSVNPLSLLTPGFLQRIWGGDVDAPENVPAHEAAHEAASDAPEVLIGPPLMPVAQ
jgi:hypothetical protein